jgi:hypothetical protein
VLGVHPEDRQARQDGDPVKVKLANGRLYVCGRHVHHGLSGLVMTIVGLALLFHDLKDFPWPLTPDWLDR